ncbi:MAG: hypothetical protein H0T86_01690 [Gemmatimonadales bacterium]|nr:hypothetical protein [Gemmatimonadales bacterium]
MVVDSSADVRLGDVVIVGGGCYGTFYAGQLLRARERNAARWRRLLIVDRDPRCAAATRLPRSPEIELVGAEWGSFFDEYLDGPPSGSAVPDTIVPSPLMPHLMYEWLLRRARARWPGRTIEPRPVPLAAGTPYETQAPDGTRFVSFADWLCPVHCIEPATCPVIRAPRTWEMTDAMHALARRLDAANPTAGPVLFTCRHRVYGVGMFDVAAVLAGDAVVAGAGAGAGSTDVLVATISACHGAASLLHLGPADGGD